MPEPVFTPEPEEPEKDAEDAMPPLCLATLEVVFDAGSTAVLENETLKSHVSSCSRCQNRLELSAELKKTTQAELHHHADGIAAGVMARLPLPPTELRVVATADSFLSKRWAWSAGVAALLLFGVGVVWFKTPNEIQRKDVFSSISIERGMLDDEKGNRVEKLAVGHTYTARSRTILDINKETVLRLEQDASFQLKAAPENFPIENIQLHNGDLYAAKTENPSAPTVAMRVSLRNFETELQSGEFYIGQSGAYSHGSGSQSVLIVFSGTAQVLDRDSIVSLNAGQIYYNVEQPIGKGSQISNTTTTETVLIRKPTPAHDSETKQMYRERVVGFETELKQLRGTLALQTEKNAQSEELEHRTQRVEEYLEQHRQRFETMNASEAEKQLPYEQIQRGIQGRTNPATWKM